MSPKGLFVTHTLQRSRQQQHTHRPGPPGSLCSAAFHSTLLLPWQNAASAYLQQRKGMWQ